MKEFVTNTKFIPLYENKSRYLILYGGADSGKSHWCGQKILYRILNERNHRILLIRKVQRTIRRSQFQVLIDLINEYNMNRTFEVIPSDLRIKGPNNCEIIAAGLDDAEKLKSIHNVTSCWVEEPTELSLIDFNQVDLRLRGRRRHYKQVLLSFNPIDDAHWLNLYFFVEPSEYIEKNTTIVHSTYKDNAYCDPDDIIKYEQFTGAFRTIYTEGKWGGHSDPDQIIPYEWINEAYQVEPVEGDKSLGCDIARYGDDKTVLTLINGNTVENIQEFEHMALDRTADIIGNLIIEKVLSADMVGVDGVGLGAGVVDNLKRKNFNVRDIIGGAAPVPDKTEYKYLNLRAQMWWNAREMFRKKEICLKEKNIKLVGDLTTPRYTIRSDKKIQVEAKDDLKKRIGRSPDHGDSLVYALFVAKMLKTDEVDITWL